MKQESKITVHMIGQAHLDPVWLWPWTEGRAEAIATSRSAVDRLNEYPDFHFTRGEAMVYEWIEREDPALFDEIAALIAADRWHVVNGMVVQPDLNTPQGEATVRQFLLGMAYFHDRFGVAPRAGYCVDTFGHPGALPQILRGCGLDRYVFMRPGPHEKEMPAGVFWWQSPDGSRVLTHRISKAYTTRTEDHSSHIQAAVDACPTDGSPAMCFFGVGNHGGGPTKRQIENIQLLAMQNEHLDIRFSHADSYFDELGASAEQLPVVSGELQPHAVGCYSANSALKRAYRFAECRLLVAERVASLASAWLGSLAPLEALRALWSDLCFCQFHDTLCGTTTKEGADDAIMLLGRVALGAQEVTHDAARMLGTTVDTSGSGGVALLFNPGAETYEGYAEYEPWTDWEAWNSGWQLSDESGEPVAHQIIETHEALSRKDQGPDRLVFPVTLPAMGYRLYRFSKRDGHDAPPARSRCPVSAGQDTLENEHLRIRLEPDTGDIISCVRVSDGLEWVGAGGWNVPLVIEDLSDTWSHDVRRFEDVIGRFGSAQIRVVDSGLLQASVLIERSYEGNHWVQQLVIRSGQAELMIHNWLYWQGQWRMIKLAFDVATAEPHACHDVPYGWTERPCDGHEVPTLMWMDVSGPAASVASTVGALEEIGLAIINDGKYGCDVSGSTARLTVLRCPPYAYHQPHPAGSKARYDWLDQGLQEFSVVLRPHSGNWRDASVVQRAREINLPPVAVTMHSHAGARPPIASLLQLDASELELAALKPAEDGEGYIVRIVDRHGRGGSGELLWFDQRFAVALKPFQVSAYRLFRRGSDPWRLTPCDMLEHQGERAFER